MELHEAIEHAREVSLRGCTECHKEHGQLADWLEELERLRSVLGDTYDLDRLRELLNICNGKTPNQVECIFEEWSHYLDFSGKMNAIEDAVDAIYDDGNVDYDRLRELVEADKEEKCVILPVKPGTQVWSTVFCRIDDDGKEHPTFPWEFSVSMFDEWGTGWHLTEKDAEAELEKENENGEY